MKKFYITIIDSGWPNEGHEMLQASIKSIKEYFSNHHLIIVPEEESRDLFREYPAEIGKDPIIIITDVGPKKLIKDKVSNGIRIDLGKVETKGEAMKYLQEVCRLIQHERFVSEISWEERRKIASSFLEDVIGDLFIECLGHII